MMLMLASMLTKLLNQGKMISDLKTYFDVSLSDTQNLPGCKSGDPEERKKTEVPEMFDWRKAHPGCPQQNAPMPANCAASYVYSTLSAMSDHICASNNHTVSLSPQEVLDCPKGGRGCKGGSVNQVLGWGKRKGFIEKKCYMDKDSTEQDGKCPDDHLVDNECRQKNHIYKVVDFCLAQDTEGVKREILKNGPVIAQMNVATDFITYKEGVYHRTADSFKFPGNHIVKVVGWDMGDEDSGTPFWIAQNVWGQDWGEDGFFKIAMGESMLDQFAMGFAAYPTSMADFYAQQNAAQDFKI